MRAKDFQGFRFGKIHSSDLNLEVVSVSNRYEARTLPAPVDSVSDIPGGDGQYYFGSVNKNREITVNIAFDNVSETDYRKIKQLLATDKLLDLVFDEEPYKTWKAKIKTKPEFKSLCFTDKETGKRVYKGDGRIVFVCYFPYAYGFDKYIVRSADYYTLHTPECIIKNLQESDNTFVNKRKEKIQEVPSEDIRYHYNLNPSDYEGGVSTNKLRDADHRNRGDRAWDPNMKTPWKTGFPSVEQVQNGELFFDTEQGEKAIIDTRGYWDNIPEWEDTAKLLTTPTLDFDQELMYMPQYSKVDYINMETGFDNRTSMIGSRILVYNPGDLPVDWEIRFDENKRGFWSTRGGTKFRVSRYNVQRLSIPNAVDWCGLTTYKPEDNEPFKYGTKYFKRRALNLEEITDRFSRLFDGKTEEQQINTMTNINLLIQKPIEEIEETDNQYYSADELLELLRKKEVPVDKHWDEEYNINDIPSYSKRYNWKQINENYSSLKDKMKNVKKSISTSLNLRLDSNEGWGRIFNNTFMLQDLGEAHPNHCYYVEPIPKEKLGHFIKLFYWQTIQWRGTKTNDGQLIELDNWKEMLPEEFFNSEKLQQGVYWPKDMTNPIIPFLKNFIIFDEENGMIIKNTKSAIDLRNIYFNLDFEEGIAFANRYEELYNECIYDEEKYELYWDTLKKLIKIVARGMYEILKKDEHMVQQINDEELKPLINNNEEEFINSFIDSYINRPLEYLNSDMRDLNYGDFVFNGYKMPQWITEDYIEIDQAGLNNVQLLKEYFNAIGEDIEAIFNGRVLYYNRSLLNDDKYTTLRKQMDSVLRDGGCLNDILDDYYYLNSNEHMLYTTANPYGMEFVYKPNKIVMNDAITQGKWFKIPPGWSMITIEPVVNENAWGGKTWQDARAFDYGYSGDVSGHKREAQQLFDYVFDQARNEFFSLYPIDYIKNNNIVVNDSIRNDNGEIITINSKDEKIGTEDLIDELLKFKIWYQEFTNQYKEENYYLIYGYYKKLQQDAEYTLLRCIHDFWSIVSPYFSWTSQRGVFIEPTRDKEDLSTDNYFKVYPDENDYDITGKPLRNINGDISDWWWYACNYFWANFPPLYWAMADMLNKIQIKYTPLYY